MRGWLGYLKAGKCTTGDRSKDQVIKRDCDSGIFPATNPKIKTLNNISCDLWSEITL